MTIVKAFAIGNADLAIKRNLPGRRVRIRRETHRLSGGVIQGEKERSLRLISKTRGSLGESLPRRLGRLNQKTRKKGEVKTNLFNLLSSLILYHTIMNRVLRNS